MTAVVLLPEPLTYGVDALRSVIRGAAWTPIRPLYQEDLILLAFDAVMMIIGAVAFGRRS